MLVMVVRAPSTSVKCLARGIPTIVVHFHVQWRLGSGASVLSNRMSIYESQTRFAKGKKKYPSGGSRNGSDMYLKMPLGIFWIFLIV